MSAVNEHVFSHGMQDTRDTFEAWNERPWVVLRAWLALSVAIALSLLVATWFVAGLLTPDLTSIHLPGLTEPSDPGDLLPILWRNSLVLALHATACVAGFIAGASMPIAAEHRTGFSRWVHVKAGEFAILFVCAVTLFSLCTQALYLGFQGSTLSYQLRISRFELILSVLPHAIPELAALFLPLAAWLIASRRGEWNQLLAATMITVALAVPTLVVAATIEVYVWPHILKSMSSYHYSLGGVQYHLSPLTHRFTR
ncbi:MAG: stage II sporulation protein M [Solirubrobacterales bacterium]|nr:stage II sporulation protein M [Solirubrobacterales bacterium]